MIRLLLLTTVANIARVHTPAAAMSLQAVDFEIFGTVQGVFFRKVRSKHIQGKFLFLFRKTSHREIEVLFVS